MLICYGSCVFQSKESWDMDCTEKLEQSRFFKEKGTNYFKASKFEIAKRMYNKVLDMLDFDAGMSHKCYYQLFIATYSVVYV